MNIVDINARQILDSRGNPTVEAEVYCDGARGRAAVPSGASTGTHEAHELRDGGDAFCGKGVQNAIENVKGEIHEALLGMPVGDQRTIDETMIALDGTKNKSRLGANAILAVSLAAAHAAASARNVPLFEHINTLADNPAMSLPVPMFNVLNGGRHARGSSDFQEYMLVPTKARTYRAAVQIAAEIFTHLERHLAEKGFSTTVGDEGGFAPHVKSNTEMLDILMHACTSAGYTPGTDVSFTLDVAASEFFADNLYDLATEGRKLSSADMISYLEDIVKKYPIISIEDGLADDVWESWTALTAQISGIQIVGDDLLVTNQTRLEKAVKEKAGNAILIKPNQVGTLTETLDTIADATQSGWRTVVSHRSGETEDVTIVHLAVGAGAGQIKTGSVSRGERTAKHNELMRIEDEHTDLSLAQPYAQ